MPITQEQEDAKHLAQANLRKEHSKYKLARLRYQRTLVSSARTLTQNEIARAAGISQPSVSEALSKARTLEGLREGFSSGSLYEMFLSYSAGELSKQQLIEELSRWEYDELSTATVDGLLVDLPNTFREVEDALVKGVIEPDVYDTVVSRIKQKG